MEQLEPTLDSDDGRQSSRWLITGLAVVLVIHLMSSLLGLQRDSAELVVTARGLLQGVKSHVGAYYVKPPGMPWLLACVFFVLGDSVFVARAFIVFVNLASALLVWRVALMLGFGGREAKWAGVFYLFFSAIYEGSQILTEPPMVLFLLLATLAFGMGLRRRWFWWCLLSGACCAFACWVKQVGVLAVPPLVAWSAIDRLRGRGTWSACAGRLGALMAGMVLTLAVLVFAAVDSSNADMFWRFVVCGLFGRGGSPGDLAVGLWGRGLDALALWVPAAAIGAMAAWNAVRREPGFRIGGAVVALFMIFQLAPMWSRHFPHYLIPALPFACILASSFWQRVVELCETVPRSVSTRAVLAVLILGPWVSAADQALWQIRQLRQGATLWESERVGRWLDALVGDDSPLVLNGKQDLYCLTRKPPPTPYLFFLVVAVRPARPDVDSIDALHAFIGEVMREVPSQHVVTTGEDLWNRLSEDTRRGWRKIAELETWQYDNPLPPNGRRGYHRVALHVMERVSAN